MDIALCVIENDTVQFSGANNSLYHVSGGALHEFKGEKQPIGIHAGDQRPFGAHSVNVTKGDAVYIFSDGYADQFGGPSNKKFMYKKLKETLIAIRQLSMEQQRERLEQIITEWMGDAEQMDDILVIGIRF
jgi:serine phosphatase RsbU (regulator of sigma subunit)